MTGLLDGITDPEVMAWVVQRQYIVERVAKQMGCAPEEARAHMDYWDQVSMETFQIGNTVDRKTLH